MIAFHTSFAVLEIRGPIAFYVPYAKGLYEKFFSAFLV
jgi:hypothetical protein